MITASVMKELRLMISKILRYRFHFNPFRTNVLLYSNPSLKDDAKWIKLKTSHLTLTANQMTGFSMKCSTGLKWVKRALVSQK